MTPRSYDLVTLTMLIVTFILKVAIWTLLPPGASVFHKHILFLLQNLSVGTKNVALDFDLWPTFENKKPCPPFCWYWNNWPSDLDLDVRPTLEKKIQPLPYLFSPQEPKSVVLGKLFTFSTSSNMAALAYDRLELFLLLLWDRCIDCDKTWQEASPKHPLPNFAGFFWTIKDDRPGLWLAKSFLYFSANHWMNFAETWYEGSHQEPLPNLCFSCRSIIQDAGRKFILIVTNMPELFVISRNLTGSLAISMDPYIWLH